MKKIIIIFLSLFLVSCSKIGLPPLTESDCCCACQCVDWSFFDYEFYEPDEDIGFVVFDYQVVFKSDGNEAQEEAYWDEEKLKHWMPENLYFSTEKYCYNPPENVKQEELASLEKNSPKKTSKGLYFSNLSHIFRIYFIKLLVTSHYAMACRPMPSFSWIHLKDEEISIPNKDQKYFIRFKIYNVFNEVVFDKNHYFDRDNWRDDYWRNRPWGGSPYHYSSELYSPYFTGDHSVKVFVVEKSTGEEIKQIGETSMISEKVKEFSNDGTKNCYVVDK